MKPKEKTRNSLSQEMPFAHASSQQLQLIEEIAEKFLENLRAGGEVDRQSFVASHPDLEPFLAERLALMENVYWATRMSPLLDFPDRPLDHDEIDETLESPSSFGSNPQRRTSRANRVSTMRVRCQQCGTLTNLVSTHAEEIPCSNCGSSVHVKNNQVHSRNEPPAPETIGRFKIKGRLGRGAFGTVYLGQDTQLDRLAAIKVPRQGFFYSDSEAHRFFREARSAATLDHPNIVQVLDVSDDPDDPFIVSKYVKGTTLLKLAESGLVSFNEAVTMMTQVADAIHFAHENGIVHRDIKPSNILVDEHAKTYVADFGLARREDAAGDVTQDGVILGTPTYMSPEQAAGLHDKVGPKSDIYSMGVVLYCLLCQQPPFKGTKQALLEQVITEEPKSPRKLNEQVPVDLETITLKAIAKSPELRFDDAKQFADELRRWLRGEPILSRRISPIRRGWQWCKRNKTVASLIGLVASLFILIGIGGVTSAMIQGNLKRTSDSRLNLLLQRNGQESLNENDLIQSAFWYSNSLGQLNSDSDRLRLGMIQDRLPKLVNVFQTGSKVSRIQFSKDGNRLAVSNEPAFSLVNHGDDTGSARDTLSLFDRQSGQQLFQKDVITRYGSFDVIDQAKKLVVESPDGKSLHFWGVAAGEQLFQVDPNGTITSFAISEDEKTILVGTQEGKAKLFDLTKFGAAIRELDFPDLRVLNVQFVADSSFAMLTTDTSGSTIRTLHLWDTTKGQTEWAFEHGAPFVSAVSSDGQKISTATIEEQSTLRAWKVPDGSMLTDPIDIGCPVERIFWDHTNSEVVVQDRKGRMESWLVESGNRTDLHLRLDFRPTAILADRDSELLALANNSGDTKIYWLSSGYEVCSTIPGGFRNPKLAFSRDKRLVAVEGKNGLVRVWDLAGALPEQDVFKHEGVIVDAMFSPQGSRVITAGVDGIASIWKTKTGEKVSDVEHGQQISALAVSPDARYFATGGSDSKLNIWDLANGSKVGETLDHDSIVVKLAFSNDSKKLVAGGLSGEIACWNVADGQQVFSTNQNGRISEIFFNKSDEFVVAASWDGGVECRNANDGERMFGPFKSPGRTSNALLSNDEAIVFAAVDQFLYAWSRSDSKLLGRLRFDDNIRQLVQTRDQKLVVCDRNGSATFVDVIGHQISKGTAVEYARLGSCSSVASTSNFSQLVIAGATSDYYKDSPESGIAVVWGLDSNTLLSPPVFQHGEIRKVTVNSAGTRILTAGFDGQSKLVSLKKLSLPVSDAVRVANLYASAEMGADNSFIEMKSDRVVSEFETLSKTYPGYFESNDDEAKAWSDHIEFLRNDSR